GPSFGRPAIGQRFGGLALAVREPQFAGGGLMPGAIRKVDDELRVVFLRLVEFTQPAMSRLQAELDRWLRGEKRAKCFQARAILQTALIPGALNVRVGQQTDLARRHELGRVAQRRLPDGTLAESQKLTHLVPAPRFAAGVMPNEPAIRFGRQRM